MKNEQRKMKNSGIEWIGEIPYNWGIIKNKYVVDLYTGNSIKDDEKYLYTSNDNADIYLSSKNIDVKNGSLILDDILYIKKNNNDFVRAHANDILMCIEGGSAGRKKTFLDKTVTFVNKLCCFHSIGIFPKYLYYILQSPHYENEFNLNMSGMIGGVTKGKLDNFIYPFPTIEEQKEIADFLDKKNKAIDSLINNEELQIEKLKEYKQSLITEVVTKGLDKNVEMKDSGVEWIGKIPKDWQVIKLKYAYISVDEKYNSGEYPYIALENIEAKSGNYVQTETNENYSLDGTIIADKNAVIFGKLRPYLAKAFLITEPSCVSSEFAVFVSNCNLTEYLKYLFLSNNFIDWVNSSTYGTKMPRANIDFIRNTYIALPNIKEQNNIVNYIKTKSIKIDDIINVKKAKTEKLNEYKKSLIYEYVTGKKEV